MTQNPSANLDLLPDDLLGASLADPFERILSFGLPLPRARAMLVDEFERRYIERVLEAQGGNVARAAAASGLARRYFQLLRAKKR